MKIGFNIKPCINQYGMLDRCYKIQDSNKRNMIVVLKTSNIYFFNRDTFFCNKAPNISANEKIKHFINRLSLLESGNYSDTFQDLNQTNDLEYLKLAVDIISFLSNHRVVVIGRLIRNYKYIGLLYLDLIRAEVFNMDNLMTDEYKNLVLELTQSFKRADK